MNARVNAAAHADAQRDRILSAAQRCFAERGFHAASMASIAETAGLSAGLIYRYFKSKHEIIHGIVQRQLDLLAADLLAPVPEHRQDLAALLVDSYTGQGSLCGDQTERGLEPTLILEITAEASRDPGIERALCAFDQAIREAMAGWLAQPHQGHQLSAREVERRALLLRFLVDGMKMHQVRRPDLDPELLHEALSEALGWLRAA